ncbi:hypothetical protein DPMN_132236 [Dreissena polymorpha]|uniref:Uncharacterized protein n=1 Tax=Dreissena polymorpha TaxID=45954 RepID=A0A9D4FR70_DREPO|nr:hypothetical protein DPMN_132236 [Dreissena polymorpha]
MSDSDMFIPPAQSRRLSQQGTFTISMTHVVYNASVATNTQADRRDHTDVMIQIHVLRDRG